MNTSIVVTSVFAACMGLLAGSARAEVRSFTDNNGRTIVGEILAIHGARVEMEVSEKKFIFPIANLSVEDQAYVKKWATLNKAYKLEFRTEAVEDPAQRQAGNDPSPLNITLPNGPPGIIAGRNASDRDVKAMTTAWRYNVIVQNSSGEDLGELSVKYNVFIRNTLAIRAEGKAESHSVVVGAAKVPALENTRRAQFATDWLEMRERDWETEKVKMIPTGQSGRVSTEKYWVDYSESTQLDGLWIKVFVDDREVADWKSEGKVIKGAAWSDESKMVQMPRSVSAANGKTPGMATNREDYLPHEDLQAIPKTPEQFKGKDNVAELWHNAVGAGGKYRDADRTRKSSERNKAKAAYDAALAEYKAAISP